MESQIQERFKIAEFLKLSEEQLEKLNIKEIICMTKHLRENIDLTIVRSDNLVYCNMCNLICDPYDEDTVVDLCRKCDSVFILLDRCFPFHDFLNPYSGNSSNNYSRYNLFSKEIGNKMVNSDDKILNYIEGKTIKNIGDFMEIYVPSKFPVLNYSVYLYYKTERKIEFSKNENLDSYDHKESSDLETYLLMNKTRFWYFTGMTYYRKLSHDDIYDEVKTALLLLNRIPTNILPRPLKQKIFRYFLDA